MNLLTDSLPAIAIGMEPADPRLLSAKPRDPKESILNKSFMLTLLLQGGLIAACTMAAFYIGLSASAAVASTMAFATLTLARLFHGFNCRSERSVLKIGFMGNPASIGAFGLGLVFLSLVLFVPFLRGLFQVEMLSVSKLSQVLGLAVAPTILIQLGKLIRRK